jgi:hypothetical protein
MFMNKTVKKLEKNLIRALTSACEQLKQDVVGFDWLTHTANYANFPNSLVVRCVFDTEQNLESAKLAAQDALMIKRIHSALLNAGILLKMPKQHVVFDTEEACAREHQGDWNKRINYAH